MKKKTKRRGYRLLVYSLESVQPDVLTFYHMTEKEIIDWIEEKLSNPFSSVIGIDVEEFYY